MTINAYNKFINTIKNRLNNYELESIREITDLSELGDILETATGYGYRLNYFKNQESFIGASALLKAYDNGLKLLSSEISYKKNDGSIRNIVQHTLTSDYKEMPILNMVVEHSRKSIQQLLVTTNTSDDIFDNNDRNIDVIETSIRVHGECGSCFKTYTNMDTNKIFMEKYNQFNIIPIKDCSIDEEELFKLCGNGRNIEILYNQQEEAIYAELSKKYSVNMLGFNKNSKTSAKRIVEIINREVDTIIEEINSSINKYEHSFNQQIRKVKKIK